MYGLLRPLLFRLDPETAHHLTLKLLRSAGWIPPARWLLEVAYHTPPRPVIALGHQFRNPVGLAAGYDKDGLAIRGLAALGFGHLEIGTVTPVPQEGNPRPRLFRLVKDEALINRLGFPSRGAAFVMAKMRGRNRAALKHTGVVLGINLGKNRQTSNEQAVFDYLELLQIFAPLADYLAINVSSPNTVGLRELQGRAALTVLLTQLNSQRRIEEKKHEKRIPLLVKLAPDLSGRELIDALEVILATGMDGVIAVNTTIARERLVSDRRSESGGLSGKPLAPRSEAFLSQVVKLTNSELPIISVGGIQGPQDARRRLDLGATLVQIYTGLIYRGPGLACEIVKAL